MNGEKIKEEVIGAVGCMYDSMSVTRMVVARMVVARMGCVKDTQYLLACV